MFCSALHRRGRQYVLEAEVAVLTEHYLTSVAGD
jgi:hypothetical protein